jgi:SAM-dependent methyltransferase
MERVPEPELMDDVEQARAYAYADFAEPHGRMIELLEQRMPDRAARGVALDLGCGPGDIAFRLATAWLGWTVLGLDGAAAMIDLAMADPRHRALGGRVSFRQARLPEAGPVSARFDLILSNSLLHHLADPLDLWRAAVRYAAPGARLFVMDLLRPKGRDDAADLVARHAAGEPDVLQRDFYNSLLAAYRGDEVEAQLAGIGLEGLAVEVVSDRHWIAHGPVEPRRLEGREESP